MQRNAFRLSAVRPTITSGGETKVRTRSATLTKPHNKPSFFISEASVIFTAFAERTRNITEILRNEKGRVIVTSQRASYTLTEITSKQLKCMHVPISPVPNV